MRKPEFEQFRATVLKSSRPIAQQDREPIRQRVVSLLEDTGLFLVQRARKDGHNEALIEVHAAWVGTDFSVDAVIDCLKSSWPGNVFEGGEQKFWIEPEEEVVELWFAWRDDQFVTGHIKITVG